MVILLFHDHNYQYKSMECKPGITIVIVQGLICLPLVFLTEGIVSEGVWELVSKGGICQTNSTTTKYIGILSQVRSMMQFIVYVYS